MATLPTQSWAEHVQAVLAGRGHSHGGAREQVIGLLAEVPCALTVPQIEEGLRARGASIGRASVYRVLDLLSELGLVERVAVGDGQARFERLDPSGAHHHHLLCRRCGQLVAFDDAGLERVIEELSERLGVEVEHHEVVLRGACGLCRQETSRV